MFSFRLSHISQMFSCQTQSHQSDVQLSDAVTAVKCSVSGSVTGSQMLSFRLSHINQMFSCQTQSRQSNVQFQAQPHQPDVQSSDCHGSQMFSFRLNHISQMFSCQTQSRQSNVQFRLIYISQMFSCQTQLRQSNVQFQAQPHQSDVQLSDSVTAIKCSVSGSATSVTAVRYSVLVCGHSWKSNERK